MVHNVVINNGNDCWNARCGRNCDAHGSRNDLARNDVVEF